MAVLTGLTLTGPSSVAPGVAVQYSGRLIETETGLPIPNKKLRVTLNGVDTVFPVTGADGTFSFSLTFPSSGTFTLRVDYLAIGLLGTPPPTDCVDGDTVMRTCLTTDPVTGEVLNRVDVNIWACDDNVWTPTGLMCDEGLSEIEPCVCWEGDDHKHPCASGDDQTYVSKASCRDDNWLLNSTICTPSEQLPDTCSLCDTIWGECASGLLYPRLTCNAYHEFVSTGLDCMRLTGAPDDLTELIISPPSVNSYSPMSSDAKIIRLGSLLSVPYRGADGKNHLAVLDTVTKSVTYFGWPSTVDSVYWFPKGSALISATEAWVFEGWASGISGSPFSLRLVKVNSAGTVLRDIRFGDKDSRAGSMIRLADGSLVGNWHQQYEVTGTSTHGFFVIKPGQEPVFVYPVIVPTAQGVSGSQRSALVQHPSTGDIWYFYHCDGFHAFGYIRLRETSTGLEVVKYNDTYVWMTDSRGIGMWGEIPPITALQEGDHIVLFYAGVRSICARTTVGTCTMMKGVFLEVDGEGVITDYVLTPYMVPYLHTSCIRIRTDGLRTAFHYRPTPEQFRLMWATTGDSQGWDVQPELLSPLTVIGGFVHDEKAVAVMLSDKTIHLFI